MQELQCMSKNFNNKACIRFLQPSEIHMYTVTGTTWTFLYNIEYGSSDLRIYSMRHPNVSEYHLNFTVS